MQPRDRHCHHNRLPPSLIELPLTGGSSSVVDGLFFLNFLFPDRFLEAVELVPFVDGWASMDVPRRVLFNTEVLVLSGIEKE